jgi:hypothetical protein
MANHRRGRPKNRRAGCLLCKPHKANGAKGGESNRTFQDLRHDLVEAVGAYDNDWDDVYPYEYEPWYGGDDDSVRYPDVISFDSIAELDRQGKTVDCPSNRHDEQHGLSFNGEALVLCAVCGGQMRVTPEMASAYRLGGLSVVQELSG